MPLLYFSKDILKLRNLLTNQITKLIKKWMGLDRRAKIQGWVSALRITLPVDLGEDWSIRKKKGGKNHCVTTSVLYFYMRTHTTSARNAYMDSGRSVEMKHLLERSAQDYEEDLGYYHQVHILRMPCQPTRK